MLIKSDAALARVLGLSPAAVCRAKKRGMPTDSAEAARCWRDANLNPLMRKDVNGIKGGSGYRGGVIDPRAAIERVHALMELSAPAIASGTFDALRVPLQEAMRAVPQEHRSAVMLLLPVMDALLDRLPALVAEALPPAPDAAVGAAMTDEEAGLMGRFWYAMACGEPFPAVLLAS